MSRGSLWRMSPGAMSGAVISSLLWRASIPLQPVQPSSDTNALTATHLKQTLYSAKAATLQLAKHIVECRKAIGNPESWPTFHHIHHEREDAVEVLIDSH